MAKAAHLVNCRAKTLPYCAASYIYLVWESHWAARHSVSVHQNGMWGRGRFEEVSMHVPLSFCCIKLAITKILGSAKRLMWIINMG